MKMMMPAKPGSPDHYQAESDMRTLMDAHAIKSDKPRHAKAKAHAKAKLMQMQAVMSPGKEPDGDE